MIDSDDPGRQYIWSNEAIEVLVGMGVENWDAVCRQVDKHYQRQVEKGTVQNPVPLARTMIRNAGLSALRVHTIRHRGRQRPILQIPIERRNPGSGDTYSLIDEQPELRAPPADEALAELRDRLDREQEQGDHRFLLEQMRRRLAEQLLSDWTVSCPVHERGCPHPANVLASAQGICTSLGNALSDQEAGTWEPAQGQPRPRQARAQADWDQRVHQRLLHLASDAARAVDEDRYGNTQAGRQARQRVARCVLFVLWSEACAAELKYLADQVRTTLRWVYNQQLQREGISKPARQRLVDWLEGPGQQQSNSEGNQS